MQFIHSEDESQIIIKSATGTITIKCFYIIKNVSEGQPDNDIQDITHLYIIACGGIVYVSILMTRNKIAKDLRTPKYRKRVIPDKKKKSKTLSYLLLKDLDERPRSKIGAASELKAAAHFMHQVHVSRSLDPQCPFDLVITNDKGESCLIDVKTLNKRRDGSRLTEQRPRLKRRWE